MKIATGIIGIFCGLFGVIGNGLLGGVSEMLDTTEMEEYSRIGAMGFILFIVEIIASGLMFSKPKIGWSIVLILGVLGFVYLDSLSGILASNAGLMGVFSPSNKRTIPNQ